MKKTCKILSGSLLVALMAFGLVKGNPVEKTGGLQVRDVLAEDVTKDVAGRIVRKADGEAPEAKGLVSEVKAQVSEEVEGKRHIRFVAALDTYAYETAQFTVIFKNGEEIVKQWYDQRVSYVYEAVEAAGETLAAADVFGEGYNYLIAFTVNNVPQAYWDSTIEVKVEVYDEAEQEYESPVATKSVQGIIDADEVVEQPKVITRDITSTFKAGTNPKEYNCEITRGNENVLGEETEVVTIKTVVNQTELDKGKVTSSGIYGIFGETIDLANAKISMMVHLDKVYKNRMDFSFYFGNSDDRVTPRILFEENGTGYTSESVGDGWYLVTMDVDVLINRETYNTSHLRVAFANNPKDAVAEFKMAKVTLIIENNGIVVEPEIPEVVDREDLSDTIVAAYNCSVEIDNTVSHDGKQSLKVSANSIYFETKMYPQSDLVGKTIEFCMKTSEIYRSRAYVTFYDSAGTELKEKELKCSINDNTTGVTVVDAGDGWTKIIINCDAAGASGTVVRKLGLKFACGNETTQLETAGIVWVDEFYIY